MAVERLTDYTRRIWTGLSSDGPDPDMQAGDVIYYMDTSTCSIITGIPAPGSIDTADLPDIGGGGGGAGINLRLLARGTYTQLNNTSNYVEVPVENPDATKVLIKITAHDTTAGTAHTRMTAWWRMYNDIFDYLDVNLFPAPEGARRVNTNGTANWSCRTSNHINAIVWFSGTTIGITVFNNSCYIDAGDYDWEIWGY